jgi:hypothetical protein
MLLHINGKFSMRKLKSSILSLGFVLKRPSLSISRCIYQGMKNLAVSVVSLILSSMGQIRSTKSSNVELLSERMSSVSRNVELKDGSSFFYVFLEKPLYK